MTKKGDVQCCYKCSCGCFHMRSDLGIIRVDGLDKLYCPTHGKDARVVARYARCMNPLCGAIYAISLKAGGISNKCEACRYPKSSHDPVKSERRYDCVSYETCLYDKPAHHDFNCNQCQAYEEESPDLKRKRNAQLIGTPSAVDYFTDVQQKRKW